MKTLVVYKSSTGFTEQYANWISEELGCNALSIRKVKKSELEKYDCIVYGGWIMGNMVMGLNKVMDIKPKKLIVFGVGASPVSNTTIEEIRKQNNIGDIPLFYMEGGFRFEKLNFIKRLMLKMVKNSIEKMENKGEKDIYMEKVLGTSFDNSDKKYVKELVTFIRENFK